MPEDHSNVPSISSVGSIFASIGPNVPEWRKIVRITQGPNGAMTSEVVTDSKITKAVDKALEEIADSDDAPAQQQMLMTAWQAIAMYLASCDDENKAAAANALKVVTNLMSDNKGIGPTPEGTFGTTTQMAAAEYKCQRCQGRSFSTEEGLMSHLKKVHAGGKKTKPGAGSWGPSDGDGDGDE